MTPNYSQDTIFLNKELMKVIKELLTNTHHFKPKKSKKLSIIL